MLRYALMTAFAFALLTACGGNAGSAGQAAGTNPGNLDSEAAAGEALFNQTLQIARAPTCKTCHVVEPDAEPVVGPSLHGIASVAGSRVPGQSAEEYLRESIVDPDAYIVEGYQSGIMARTYDQLLTPEQIDSLVAYMLTLE